MAESSESKSPQTTIMFREEAMRKMSSAEDLDRYLKVTSSAAWTLVLAAVILLTAGIIWGASANIPLTTNTIGIIKDGSITCFLPLDDNPLATTDSKVTVSGHETSIVSVNSTPWSKREVNEEVGSDYTASEINVTQWSYKVTVAIPDALSKPSSELEEGDEVPVQIVTREIAPLAALFGGV